MANDRYLIIPDLQMPFEAQGALKFCLQVQKEFRIPKTNIYNVGDEFDCYYGSSYPKNPNIDMTAKQEIEQAREKAKSWYKAFPDMKLCTSNHGDRYPKRLQEAQIPALLMRDTRAIWHAPKSWIWARDWEIDCKYPIVVFHGNDYSSAQALSQSALDYGMNTAFGHHHSKGGSIVHIRTKRQRLWSANSGCLINTKSFAFDYDDKNRLKPSLGVLVAVDSGFTPLWIPYDGSL